MSQPARESLPLLTVEQFLTYPIPQGKAELVRGELRVALPPGASHGAAASNLVFLLAAHVRENGLGRVFGDSFGYELVRLPRTVRVPDGSFVRADRLPQGGVGPKLVTFAPDLVIEVLSSNEPASELEEKLDDYLISGTSLIWVVDPMRRTVMVVAADAPVHWLKEGDMLEAGAVIPGFSCAVCQIFEGIARQQSHQ